MFKSIVEHFDAIFVFDKISEELIYENSDIVSLKENNIKHIDHLNQFFFEIGYTNHLPICDSISLNNISYLLKRTIVDRYIVFHFEDNQYFHKIIKTLKEESTIDELTSCYNKKETELIFKRMLASYLRYSDTYFTVVMFDIDHFKKVNDTYGHLAGDFVLKELTQQIKSHLRDSDFFGRVGGEEFTLLLSQTKLNGALKLSKKIKDFIENHKFSYQNEIIPITISIGVTSIIKNDSYFSIVDRVDKALYKAKNNGRNRIEYL
ncbi:MAG: GGDEF domain-containing protein [Campylobacterota bacterium]|nr:GGDEF domain-containing protein [Campylobacterota bacterium]